MITIQPSNIQRGAPKYMPYLPSMAMQTAEPQFFMTAYPLQFNLITGAAAISTNTYEMQVLGRTKHAIAVSGTFVATVFVEATLDGVNWVTLQLSINAPGIVQFDGLYQSIRVSVSTYTSGSVTVVGMTQRS